MPLMVLQLSGSGPDLFRQHEAAQLDFTLLLKIRSVVVCCCNRNPSLRMRRNRRVSGTRKSQILSSATHLKRSAFRSFCMLRCLFIEVREDVCFFFLHSPTVLAHAASHLELGYSHASPPFSWRNSKSHFFLH